MFTLIYLLSGHGKKKNWYNHKVLGYLMVLSILREVYAIQVSLSILYLEPLLAIPIHLAEHLSIDERSKSCTPMTP